MKIRTGFVANSSSSSFIVSSSVEVKSIVDILENWFDKDAMSRYKYYNYGEIADIFYKRFNGFKVEESEVKEVINQASLGYESFNEWISGNRYRSNGVDSCFKDAVADIYGQWEGRIFSGLMDYLRDKKLGYGMGPKVNKNNDPQVLDFKDRQRRAENEYKISKFDGFTNYYLQDLIGKSKDGWLYMAEFSDNEGDEDIEHSDFFWGDLIPYDKIITISNH